MAETETVLLNRFARTGDAQAFSEIIRRHAGVVYGAALRVLADVDRASDVAQETFLQLTKDAGSVTGSLPGWLHRVATHKAIDQMRRDASRRHREATYTAQQPRQAAEWKDISPFVDQELNELDPQLRTVLIAHFLQGRTTREIARLYGTSQATVSRRIESGVEQLRAKLRRRGIIVAMGTLSMLLGENAVEAAPLVLLSELGKMALVGGSAAATTSGLSTVTSSLLAAAKTKAVAVAAVAVIGAGSVVAYKQVVKPAVPAPPAAVASAPAAPILDPPAAPRRQPAPVDVRSQAAEEWDAMVDAADQSDARDGDVSTLPPGVLPPGASARDGRQVAPRGGGFGGMMGGFGGGMAMAGSPAPQEDIPEQGMGQVAVVRSGEYSPGGPGYDDLPADANEKDPNDPNAVDPNAANTP